MSKNHFKSIQIHKKVFLTFEKRVVFSNATLIFMVVAHSYVLRAHTTQLCTALLFNLF